MKPSKKKYSIDQMARMKSIAVLTKSGDTVEIDYSDLSISIISGQVCMCYASDDGDLVMPLVRTNILQKMINEQEK